MKGVTFQGDIKQYHIMSTRIPCIAFMGDLTVDQYVRQGEIHLGGSSLTGAIWARREGAKSSIIAAVGSDSAGEEYSNMLTHEYIDKSYVTVIRGKTSAIDIITTDEGERTYGEWNPGVLATYHFAKKDFAFMRKHDAAVLTVYGATQHLLRAFSDYFSRHIRCKLLRVVDFGDLSHFEKSTSIVEGHLEGIDICVFGLDKDDDEGRINALRELAADSGKLFVITLNKHGSVVFQGDKAYGCVGKEVRAVDTTGAGDSFLAAFLVSYLRAKDIQASLKKGAALAARVIAKLGAY